MKQTARVAQFPAPAPRPRRKAMRRAPGTGSVWRPSYRTPGGELRHQRLYWIAYRVGTVTKREPAKTADKREAERLLRARLAVLDRGDIPAGADRSTWDDLAAMIRADYVAHGRRSGARLEISLKHLDAAFAGQRAAGITPDRITAYVAGRLEAGAARATVNRELAALKRAFRLAARAGRLLTVPYVALLRESNARAGFFERAEFDRLRKALPPDLRPLGLVGYLTGWRLTSELLTRQWRHVQIGAREGGWLRLDPGETKGGEGRQFPLFPELRGALRAQRRATTALERRQGRVIPWVFHHEGAPLFYRAKAGLLPSAYFRAAWTAAAKAAGVEDRIRHDFRRTAARDLLRAGVPVPTVMRAMGWASEPMLRRYAIVGTDELVDAGKKRARLRQ